jgi:cytochrome P450
MLTRATAAVEAHEAQPPEKHEFSIKTAKPNDLFRTVLASRVLDPSDRVPARVSQEGFTIVAAGSETTGRVLTTAFFYILASQDRVLPRLQEELNKAMPNPNDRPSLQELENLTWLVGLHSAVPSRRPVARACV